MRVSFAYHSCLIVLVLVLLAGCGTARPNNSYRPDYSRPEVQDLSAILIDLSRDMDSPIEESSIRMGMIYSSEINAANAGNNVFYFTNGLLDPHDRTLIRGVVAHELAHEDLGHVGEKIAVSVAVSTVFVVLDAFLPGAGALNRAANPLITRAFSRTQELEADAQAITLLTRDNLESMERPAAKRQARRTMLHTLEVLQIRHGNTGGGMLASHPAVSERMAKLEAKADYRMAANGDGRALHTSSEASAPSRSGSKPTVQIILISNKTLYSNRVEHRFRKVNEHFSSEKVSFNTMDIFEAVSQYSIDPPGETPALFAYENGEARMIKQGINQEDDLRDLVVSVVSSANQQH